MACTSCLQVSLPSCPSQIAVNGGLSPSTMYRWEIENKFGQIFNGITTTDATGLLAINIIDDPYIPKGSFMSFSGPFILKVYRYISVYEIETAQFVIETIAYDCAELRFRDYLPSISYFDPDAPIYVPPITTPIEVTFINQTVVVVTHGLGYKPFVTILDETNEVILPLAIVHDSNNQFTVTFDVASSGTIIYR